MASSSADTKESKYPKRYEISLQGIVFVDQHLPWMQDEHKGKTLADWKTAGESLISSEGDLKDELPQILYAQFLNGLLEVYKRSGGGIGLSCTEMDNVLDRWKKDEKIPSEIQEAVQTIRQCLTPLLERAMKLGHITELFSEISQSKIVNPTDHSVPYERRDELDQTVVMSQKNKPTDS